MISMGTEAGYQADWYPMMDMLGRVAIPVSESDEPQAKDFTDYAACVPAALVGVVRRCQYGAERKGSGRH